MEGIFAPRVSHNDCQRFLRLFFLQMGEEEEGRCQKHFLRGDDRFFLLLLLLNGRAGEISPKKDLPTGGAKRRGEKNF